MSESFRISVRIDLLQKAILDEIANSLDLKFSDLIRFSITNYISSFKSWKPIFQSIYTKNLETALYQPHGKL